METLTHGQVLARFGHALSDPVRSRLLLALRDAPGYPADLADLLGTKLVANEFVAFVKLTSEYRGALSDRSYVLATYALTGFANLGSIGIQLGGIGAMAPSRRSDLARLGSRALLGGFLATLINAAIASMML